jgi:hypothetical protein
MLARDGMFPARGTSLDASVVLRDAEVLAKAVIPALKICCARSPAAPWHSLLSSFPVWQLNSALPDGGYPTPCRRT